MPQFDGAGGRSSASTRTRPWARFDAGQPTRAGSARQTGRPAAAPAGPHVTRRPRVPADLGRTPTGTASTQAALGRALLDLTREAPEAARRIVTVSPDVSSSTNLGGWINKVGRLVATRAPRLVRRRRRDAAALAGAADRPAHRARHRRDQPGRACSASSARRGAAGAQPLLPIGVLYDPFVERALEPWSFGIYAGGQSILVGTPSGRHPRPRGRRAPVDHDAVDRPRAAGLRQLRARPSPSTSSGRCSPAWPGSAGPAGRSAYLRLSTRPVDQALAAVPADPAARERRRRQVVAGAYPLRAAATRRSPSSRWAR